MERYLLKLFSILIMGFGLVLVVKPNTIADKLQSFYSKYPLVRYAGKNQLTSRPQFIIFAGVIFIIIGLICFLTGK